MRFLKEVIIWPEYFDSTLPRRLGRRVPLALGVSRPKLRELLEACRNLGMECEEVRGKKYPRTWYQSEGYLLVKSPEESRKTELIKMIARELVKLRSRKS